MQGGIFTYGLLAGLAIALLVAAFTDLRRRQIDNWLNLAIVLTAPLLWLASDQTWVDIAFHLAIAITVFVLLAAMFALGAMGGGDVKLLTALALWIEPIGFVKLLVIMSVLGGLLTLVMTIIHFARKQKGRIAVPYGIAISCAGLWVIFSDYMSAIPSSLLTG